MGGVLSMPIRRPYQERNLSAGRRLPDCPGKFLEMSAQKFLVEFGDLACDHCRTVAQNFERILERIRYPMRSFIENQKAALGCQFSQCFAPSALPRRQESQEHKFVGRHPRGCQRSHKSRGSWNGLDPNSMSQAKAD